MQPGVVNLNITQTTAPLGLYYAPDPSSQMACTIGGNAAENAGGPHCLKYGMTTNHILAIEVVLANGEIVRLGNPAGECVGMDLLGTIVGSEGTFVIVTEITIRLLPKPQAVKTLLAAYHSVEACSQTVSDIIGRESFRQLWSLSTTRPFTPWKHPYLRPDIRSMHAPRC